MKLLFYSRVKVIFFGQSKNSCELLNKLKSRGFCASNLSTYDFTTLYITLPHILVKDKLEDLIVFLCNHQPNFGTHSHGF